jgi:ribulose 1,5-bisphosphate synthetase/thiazole synthase
VNYFDYREPLVLCDARILQYGARSEYGRLNSEVVVIGGGLSGLTAAALLGRAGKAVSPFE